MILSVPILKHFKYSFCQTSGSEALSQLLQTSDNFYETCCKFLPSEMDFKRYKLSHLTGLHLFCQCSETFMKNQIELIEMLQDLQMFNLCSIHMDIVCVKKL